MPFHLPFLTIHGHERQHAGLLVEEHIVVAQPGVCHAQHEQEHERARRGGTGQPITHQDESEGSAQG